MSTNNPWMVAFTALAAGAAIVGALFTHRSTQLFEESMRRHQESMLVTQRIDACAELEASAYAIHQAARSAHFAATTIRVSEDEWPEYYWRVANAVNGFSRVQKLEMLGPAMLADAELELWFAAAQISTSVPYIHSALDTAALSERLDGLAQETREFHRACTEAVGSYRTGPGGLRPDIHVPPAESDAR